MQEAVNPIKGPVSVSIITPTYLGRDRLRGVIKSVATQHTTPLEWIVVMDGYDRETEAIIEEARALITIPIVILSINRNHKKAAVNAGVSRARGEFCLIADDDDEFPSTAIEDLVRAWLSLSPSQQQECVGVTGLCVDDGGRVIGDSFPEDSFLASSLECSLVSKIAGEKWGMQRTDILKTYPFFEDAEGCVPEGTVWLAIGEKYKTLYINKIVRNYHFNPNSVTHSSYNKKKYLENCQGWAYGYKWFIERCSRRYAIHSPLFFAGCFAEYVRNTLHAIAFSKYREWMWPGSSPSAAIGFLVGLPIGVLLFIKDRLRFAFRE